MDTARPLYFKLIDDWIAVVRRYGEDELGFQFPSHTTGEEDVWLANRMSRAPVRRPRTIELAKDFEIPDKHSAGWENLRSKIERGDDLLPHLSRGVRNVGAKDPMLNHWRINHFHLGLRPDPKHPGLIEGTGDILYASILNDKFLALRIDGHGRWSDKQLLQALVNDWPDHPDVVRGMTLVRSYSDQEEAELRKNNLTVPTRLQDGSYFMSLGETLGGSGGRAVTLATGRRGQIAAAGRDLAEQRGAGNGPDDATLLADDDWALYLDLPKLGERLPFLMPSGAAFTIHAAVESWRA